MKIKYVCEICGKDDFGDKEECNEHELEHKLEEKPKMLPEGAIVCPVCNGKGWDYRNDGVDITNCYKCDGKKFVIPKIVPSKTVYVPVD